MKFIYYFITKHRLVNIVSLLLVVLGFISVRGTNVDLIPPMDFKGITVSFSYPEATAGDIEEYVVFPLEERIANFPGLKSFSSTSRNGGATVRLSFPADFKNINGSLVEVKEIVEELKPSLPQGIRNILVQEDKKTDAFQNYIVFNGVDLANKKHDNLIKGFKNGVSNIRGVIEIEDKRPEKLLEVDFVEDKLKEKEITVSDALVSIRQYLEYVPLGSIKRGSKKTLIEFKKYDEGVFIDKIKNLPIKANSFGYGTKLKDVAQVSYTFDKREYTAYENGNPRYGIRIAKDLNSDVLKIDEKVRIEIEKFNQNKEGLFAKSTISGKGFIVRQLKALKSNGAFGVFLVTVLLILFLSMRSALCTVWGVPIAYAGTFSVIYLLGMSINLLSIVGLIIVAGILVDDALIVTEKYNEELEKGRDPHEAAKIAIKDLFLPVLGTALTTVVAFLPLILIPSEMGEILKSIPIVIIAALFFSIFESFFILPSHLVTFDKGKRKAALNTVFFKLRFYYQIFIQKSLKHKYITVFIFLGLSAGAVFYSLDVEKNFNLNIGDEFVMLRGALKSSASKTETLERTKDLYAFIKEIGNRPEIIDVEMGVGRQWSFSEELIGAKYFEMRLMVDETYHQPEKIKNILEEQINDFLDQHEDDEKYDQYEFLNVQRNYAGAEEKTDQKYLAFDFYTRNSGINLDLKTVLKSVKTDIDGLGEIELGDDSKKIEKWVFDPDYLLLSQLGITKDQIQDSILGKVQNAWLSDVRINGESVAIVTTIDGKSIERTDFDPAKNFVITSEGNKVSLSSIGKWKQVETPETIKHLNAYKVQKAKFPILKPEKRDEIIEKSKMVIEKISQIYPQYIIKSSGESLQEAENREWILNALLACIIGIYFILVVVLGSFFQPVIVGLPILFGVIGVLLAHKLHGMPLGVFSGVGLVGAIGVSVNGSLVMADQINSKLKNTQMSILRAIEEGALSRFRAILLTSLTTLGGLFPMAYGLGGDSGFTKALAFSMAWGISLASVLTLFFFPAIFAVLSSFSNRCALVWSNFKK